MTKGHLHERNDQPEMYICLAGSGYLLLDTLDGEFRAEAWQTGTITHIPAIWAHRVANTGTEIMVYIGVYHAAAGHNYALVEEKGFAAGGRGTPRQSLPCTSSPNPRVIPSSK